jgi:hypothetical protein
LEHKTSGKTKENRAVCGTRLKTNWRRPERSASLQSWLLSKTWLLFLAHSTLETLQMLNRTVPLKSTEPANVSSEYVITQRHHDALVFRAGLFRVKICLIFSRFVSSFLIREAGIPGWDNFRALFDTHSVT